MSLIDVDVDKAGKDAVDEAAKVLVPELDPIIEAGIAKLVEGLKSILVGRTITITIN